METGGGRPCPQCGQRLTDDDRFVVWCTSCDWNVRGGIEDEEEHDGPVDAFRRRLSRAYGEELFARMTSERPPRPGRGAAYVGAYTIAGLVHLLTLAVAGAGVWLLVTGWRAVIPAVLGTLLLGLAWLMRPRLGRLRRHGVRLERADAPALYALLDEVADTLGAPRADVVVVDADVNASVSVFGLRRRRMLVLGLGLWEALTPQQRVGLLGHEFGHLVNGDTSEMLVIGSAYRTLIEWYVLLRPQSGTSGLGLVETAARLLMFVPASAVLLLLHALAQLTLRARQQAEYLADDLEARIGSTEAAIGGMDVLLLADAIAFWLDQQYVTAGTVHRATRGAGREPDEAVWERLKEYVASIPGHELERRRRVSVLTAHAEDQTHPPTHLRRAAVERREHHAAAIVLDVAWNKEVDAELDPARRSLGREVLRG
ncbi:M48 family metalloprotease [Actinacidiphila glaucinigra]|uniref:M48 family metalloprotease n=1 Tax=Actinacidiphila glaucinigra TaxID=235986 RepID=UPI00371C692B